jgi:Xaa-Pro aminopeptidase
MVMQPLSTLLFSEPGYYHEGHFGVRLENVLEVVKKQPKVK